MMTGANDEDGVISCKMSTAIIEPFMGVTPVRLLVTCGVHIMSHMRSIYLLYECIFYSICGVLI